MPPKRKRVEDATPAEPTEPRTTRRSTRVQNKEVAATTEGATAATTKAAEPATKRKKTTTTKAQAAPKEAKKAASTKATKKASKSGDDDTTPAQPAAKKKVAKSVTANGSQQSLPARNGNADASSSTTSTSVPTQQASTRASTPPPAAPVVPQPAQPPAELKVQPYTPQRALALFQKYADSDDPNVIGPEGFEALCMESGIPLEGALPLILAWQLDSKEMAKITKEEWVKGMETLKIASLPALATALNDLQNMLIMQQGAVPKSTVKKDPDVYDKTLYMTYAQDIKAAFGKLYTYCFGLAKQEGSRNIDMETSCAFWSVLLAPQYPIMKDVLDFIAEKGTYKATNKDLWSMMLEFCRTVDPSLKDYESDGAWPTLLDDFVAWKKAQTGGTSAE